MLFDIIKRASVFSSLMRGGESLKDLLIGALVSIFTGVILHLINKMCDKWLDDHQHTKHK